MDASFAFPDRSSNTLSKILTVTSPSIVGVIVKVYLVGLFDWLNILATPLVTTISVKSKPVTNSEKFAWTSNGWFIGELINKLKDTVGIIPYSVLRCCIDIFLFCSVWFF